MGMSSAQSTAFKAASGNIDASVLHLLCIGLLLATLFLWAAWGLMDVYNGWAHTRVRNATLVRFCIRTVLLLVVSIWMFAS
ncbi:TIGR03758 family integrating conjugative element protein [Serratia sp. JSRIV006]|uniref:TIGR03758 family integrating conjugative element protein n=1 Tax=Serratia sp. JSRIV006 TaxID=2831896 RepID=UPI001CBD4204|nr:TIGR03758 family integrating conjugative element protein [Serratia sp. JSRIV006]UAN63385.1 TIGR03758 family integrating conjugative element protein [Serratia sp. JSRIV006]